MANRNNPLPKTRPDTADEQLVLPFGTTLTRLQDFTDERGTIAELYRANWPTGIVPAQWSMTTTAAGVLRGVHVHLVHDDYFCLLLGRLCVGLSDLRPGSPTQGFSACVELSGDSPSALFIPHGVAHGIYSHTAATYVLGTSHYYDPADELGCHWNDADLGLAWPCTSPILSARDAALPSVFTLLPSIRPWEPA